MCKKNEGDSAILRYKIIWQIIRVEEAIKNELDPPPFPYEWKCRTLRTNRFNKGLSLCMLVQQYHERRKKMTLGSYTLTLPWEGNEWDTGGALNVVSYWAGHPAWAGQEFSFCSESFADKGVSVGPK